MNVWLGARILNNYFARALQRVPQSLTMRAARIHNNRFTHTNALHTNNSPPIRMLVQLRMAVRVVPTTCVLQLAADPLLTI